MVVIIPVKLTLDHINNAKKILLDVDGRPRYHPDWCKKCPVALALEDALKVQQPDWPNRICITQEQIVVGEHDQYLFPQTMFVAVPAPELAEAISVFDRYGRMEPREFELLFRRADT